MPIYSKRFFLRTLTQHDVGDEYLNWVSGPRKSEYIEYSNQHRTMNDLQCYVIERMNSKHALLFGIFTREEEKHIGNIKYEPIDFHNKTAVMGILIGDESWRGKGVAPEVIKSSSEWLSQQYGINKIILGVNPDNTAAMRAYKKIGFKEDCALKEKEGQLFMTLQLE